MLFGSTVVTVGGMGMRSELHINLCGLSVVHFARSGSTGRMSNYSYGANGADRAQKIISVRCLVTQFNVEHTFLGAIFIWVVQYCHLIKYNITRLAPDKRKPSPPAIV